MSEVSGRTRWLPWRRYLSENSAVVFFFKRRSGGKHLRGDGQFNFRTMKMRLDGGLNWKAIENISTSACTPQPASPCHNSPVCWSACFYSKPSAGLHQRKETLEDIFSSTKRKYLQNRFSLARNTWAWN